MPATLSDATRQPSERSLRALDALNIFLADVRDGVGPYLAIYLLATHHWDAASIGIAMSVAGFAGVITQTPAGALVDRVRAKRLLIALSSAAIAVGCVLMVVKTTMSVIVVGQSLIGAAAAVIAPAVAAITLGLVGHRQLDRRVGRNESFNHAGNVLAAALAGLLGHYVGREFIFYLVAAMAAASLIAVFAVREDEIDHKLARGALDGAANVEATDRAAGDTTARRDRATVDAPHVSGIGAVLSDRRVLAFAVAVVLFHFANAAMLPLVGQLLSDGKQTGASLYMSACIITAQFVMIPVAVWSGRAAHAWGRKVVFLVAFFVLPVRGALYTLSGNPYFLVSVQLLDGIAAGIFGVVTLIMIADLTRGTGRFNLVQGAIGTATGIGASLSVLMTGYVVNQFGYNAGFLTLAAIAALALGVFWFFVPETQPDGEPENA